MLEPEPLGGVGVLGLLGEGLLFLLILDPVARLLIGVALQLGLILGLVLVGDQLDVVIEIVLILVLVGGGALDGTEILVVLLILLLLRLLLVLVLFGVL